MSTFLSLLGTTLISASIFFLQYVAPGVWLITATLGRQLKLRAYEQFALGVMANLSAQSLVFFLLGSFIGSRAYVLSYFFLGVGVWALPSTLKVVRRLWQGVKTEKIFSVGALIAVISLASTLAFSWITTSTSFFLQQGQLHDSAWHIALINNLQSALPPEHPSSAAFVVNQYHYFYDVIIAAMAKSYWLPGSVVYFQFFPFVLAFLLAAGVVMISTRLHSKQMAGLALFWTFFGGSLAYVIPWFLPANSWSESSFWVSQTFAMMINPQMIFSLATTVTVGWLLLLDTPSLSAKGRGWIHGLALLIMVASIGFKSYGWLVMGAMYGTFLLFKLLTTRQLFYAVCGGLFGLLSLPVVWLITGFNTSSFFWHPLWYLTTMVEAPDRLNFPQMRLQELVYLADNNWFGVFRVKVYELIIFVIGNLGTRILLFGWPLVWAWDLVARRQRPALQPVPLALLASTLFSAIFPMLFLQRGAVWNSIQFWYYTLLFANLFVAWLLVELPRRWRLSSGVSLILALVLIFATLPTYVVTQQEKIMKYEIFDQGQKELLTQLSSDSKVLICPGSGPLYQTSLVTAFSGASIYLANPAQMSITGDETAFKATHEALVGVFESRNPGNIETLIREERITHVLCDRSEWLSFIEAASHTNLQTSGSWYLAAIPQ